MRSIYFLLFYLPASGFIYLISVKDLLNLCELARIGSHSTVFPLRDVSMAAGKRKNWGIYSNLLWIPQFFTLLGFATQNSTEIAELLLYNGRRK